MLKYCEIIGEYRGVILQSNPRKKRNMRIYFISKILYLLISFDKSFTASSTAPCENSVTLMDLVVYIS